MGSSDGFTLKVRRVGAAVCVLGALSVAVPAPVGHAESVDGYRLYASDGLATRFGRSNALEGDLAFVGDDWQGPGGAVYVYRYASGRWMEIQKLEGDPGDGLANSLDVDGPLLVAGSPTGGAAYVFRFDGDRYVREAKLEPGRGLIGTSVGVSGETVVVSALQRYPRGATFVYEYDNGRWRQTDELTVPDASDIFGHCAIQGDTIVIGDTRYDFVSVFERLPGGWTETARVTPEGDTAATRINFGLPVRIDGAMLVAGAVWDNEAGPRAGAAFAFEKRGPEWVQTGKFMPATADQQFGGSLAVENGRLVAGAVHRDAVFVYEYDGTEWAATLEIDQPSTGVQCEECRFGMFVGVSGQRLIAGEPGGNQSWVFEIGGAIEISMDVLPWSTRDLIDPGSTRLVPVAMHGGQHFDALQTDLPSVRIMPGNAPARNYRVMDVNRDGLPDLVVYFRSRDLPIPCGTSQLDLTASTHQGLELLGADTVTNMRCR